MVLGGKAEDIKTRLSNAGNNQKHRRGSRIAPNRNRESREINDNLDGDASPEQPLAPAILATHCSYQVHFNLENDLQTRASTLLRQKPFCWPAHRPMQHRQDLWPPLA